MKENATPETETIAAPDISITAVKPGIEYTLPNHSGVTCVNLKFVERTPSKLSLRKGVPLAMTTASDGVETEAVLLACLDRLQFLQSCLPCIQNVLAVHHLEIAINILGARKADRVTRGVEGTAAR